MKLACLKKAPKFFNSNKRKGFALCAECNYNTKIEKALKTFKKSYNNRNNFIHTVNFLKDKNLYELGFTEKENKQFDKLFKDEKKFSNFQKRLNDCGSYLEFRYYHRKDEVKLHNANFCKADKLCPACAIRRAYKQQQKFISAFNSSKSLSSKNWYYIVIPVQHTIKDKIEDVYNRLDKVRKSILKAIRNNKAGRKSGFWGQFAGGMGSIEVTKSNNGWNVHLNLLVCTDNEIDLKQKISFDVYGNVKTNYINEDLKEHLIKVTNGSYIHNISKIDTSSEDSLKSNLVEVLKYSLKFSSLTSVDLLRVYLSFYRKRLFFTFGNLWGLKLEDVELEGDEIIDDEFLELIYSRSYGDYKLKKKRYRKIDKSTDVKVTKKQTTIKKPTIIKKPKPIEIIFKDKYGLIQRKDIYNKKYLSDFYLFNLTMTSPPFRRAVEFNC